jgi:hypothetical protein
MMNTINGSLYLDISHIIRSAAFGDYMVLNNTIEIRFFLILDCLIAATALNAALNIIIINNHSLVINCSIVMSSMYMWFLKC